MIINVITAFPNFFDNTICSVLERAVRDGILKFNIIDIKKYGIGHSPRIDDTPYGGGCGMILRADVIEKALKDNINLEEYIN